MLLGTSLLPFVWHLDLATWHFRPTGAATLLVVLPALPQSPPDGERRASDRCKSAPTPAPRGATAPFRPLPGEARERRDTYGNLLHGTYATPARNEDLRRQTARHGGHRQLTGGARTEGGSAGPATGSTQAGKGRSSHERRPRLPATSKRPASNRSIVNVCSVFKRHSSSVFRACHDLRRKSASRKGMLAPHAVGKFLRRCSRRDGRLWDPSHVRSGTSAARRENAFRKGVQPPRNASRRH